MRYAVILAIVACLLLAACDNGNPELTAEERAQMAADAHRHVLSAQANKHLGDLGIQAYDARIDQLNAGAITRTEFYLWAIEEVDKAKERISNLQSWGAPSGFHENTDRAFQEGHATLLQGLTLRAEAWQHLCDWLDSPGVAAKVEFERKVLRSQELIEEAHKALRDIVIRWP